MRIDWREQVPRQCIAGGALSNLDKLKADEEEHRVNPTMRKI